MGTSAGTTTRRRKAAHAGVAADEPVAQVAALAPNAGADSDAVLAPDRAPAPALAPADAAAEPAPLVRRPRVVARPAPAHDELRRATGRRLVALLALLLLPLTVLVLATAGGPAVAISSADASFISSQIVVADQRVRAQLVRLRDLGTARALARTRDAILTTRSLAVELGDYRGDGVDRLRRALRLERNWLDAVGSTLSNPRSPLRAQLLARDADARRALASLPAPPAVRTGGARSLVAYALAREQATVASTQP